MEKHISIKELAQFHQISETILREFAESGLFELHIIQSEPCIFPDQLERYERAIRLYRDLGVNKEGVEIIMEMREKMAQMQSELAEIRRQLKKMDERLHKPYVDSFYDIETEPVKRV